MPSPQIYFGAHPPLIYEGNHLHHALEKPTTQKLASIVMIISIQMRVDPATSTGRRHLEEEILRKDGADLTKTIGASLKLHSNNDDTEGKLMRRRQRVNRSY
jgi:hypothetical protein